MPLLRLARIEDYEAHPIPGGVLYQVKWEERVCPGSPTTDPAEGVHLYNDYITKCAAGAWPGRRRLDDAIKWCLESPLIDAAHLAAEISDYFNGITDFPMLPKQKLSAEYVKNRTAVFRDIARVKSLPAHTVMALNGRALEVRNGK